MLPNYLIQEAIGEANKSTGVGKNKNYRLGAVLFSSDSHFLFSSGHNSYGTHPLASFYEYPHMHAETDAIIKAGTDHIGPGISLFVTRILKNGNLTMAKPCPHCINLMKYVGINEAYYTNWSGHIECMDLKHT